MDKISDPAFRVMCAMWGVDAAIKAANRMGLKASEEQIAEAREEEAVSEKRWGEIFKPKEG